MASGLTPVSMCYGYRCKIPRLHIGECTSSNNEFRSAKRPILGGEEFVTKADSDAGKMDLKSGELKPILAQLSTMPSLGMVATIWSSSYRSSLRLRHRSGFDWRKKKI